MIIVIDTRGGYQLRRVPGDGNWEMGDGGQTPNSQATSFVVREDELPGLLAALLARATDADEWDLFAFLCGNDQIAPSRQVVRP